MARFHPHLYFLSVRAISLHLSIADHSIKEGFRYIFNAVEAMTMKDLTVAVIPAFDLVPIPMR